MFEATLASKLKKIFEYGVVKFDQPGESKEQDRIFCEIDKAHTHFKDGIVYSKVEGKISVFAQNDKLPFGYFSKCIENHPDDTKDLFFYDFEDNTRLYENIVQRTLSFVYFFNGQHDPALGTLTSVSIEVST